MAAADPSASAGGAFQAVHHSRGTVWYLDVDLVLPASWASRVASVLNTSGPGGQGNRPTIPTTVTAADAHFVDVTAALTQPQPRSRVVYVLDDESVRRWAEAFGAAGASAAVAATRQVPVVGLDQPRSMCGEERRVPRRMLDQLPRYSLTSYDVADQCAICLSLVKVGEEVIRLPCLCVFHAHEIESWLSGHVTCPTHVTTSVKEHLAVTERTDDIH